MQQVSAASGLIKKTEKPALRHFFLNSEALFSYFNYENGTSLS
jgi:hypothetical protein